MPPRSWSSKKLLDQKPNPSFTHSTSIFTLKIKDKLFSSIYKNHLKPSLKTYIMATLNQDRRFYFLTFQIVYTPSSASPRKVLNPQSMVAHCSILAIFAFSISYIKPLPHKRYHRNSTLGYKLRHTSKKAAPSLTLTPTPNSVTFLK